MSSEGPKKDAKKPYESPKLVIYGGIRDLTQTGGTHRRDHGRNKT